MILAVTGWREFPDREFVHHHLDLMLVRGYTLFRVACARGADAYAREWVKLRQVPFELYTANWDALGKAAGGVRNRNMLLGRRHGQPPGPNADMCIGFPEPGVHNVKDSGTWGCLKSAAKYGIGVWVPPYRKTTVEGLFENG